jgi:hypothetical protein
MLYRSWQRQGDDHRVDMTAIDALMPRRLGRIRVLFKRLVFSASEMGRSRRAVERELEEMHHPFDCIDYWRKSRTSFGPRRRQVNPALYGGAVRLQHVYALASIELRHHFVAIHNRDLVVAQTV